MSTREQLLAEADATRPRRPDICERISDAFVALDAEWRCTYVNAQAARMFGRAHEDLLGKHIWTNSLKTLINLSTRHAARQLKHNNPSPWKSIRLRTTAGLRTACIPRQRASRFFFQDITERKHTENELRRRIAPSST